MAKKKFSYSDFKIGDKVLTTSGDTGIIVAIKSIEYINDKLLRKSALDKTLIDIAPFKFDSVRHKDIWYSVLTLAVIDTSVKNNPLYYLQSIDVNEVKLIIPEQTEEIKPNKFQILLNKIKTLFKTLKLKK